MQHNRTNTEYFAGMWSDCSLWDLMWYSAIIAAPSESRSTGLSIAPSWSWASVTMAIEYSRVATTEVLEHELVHITSMRGEYTDSNNPCGNMVRAELTLRGAIKGYLLTRGA